MFQIRRHQEMPNAKFAWRMTGVILFAGAIAFAALGIGVLGYHHYGHMGWVDSLLNASMILTGMGPVEAEKLDRAGKIFASVYAMFSGLVFISLMGIIIAPIAHRVLHRFHIDETDLNDESPTPKS